MSCDLTFRQGQSAFLWGPRKVGKSTLLAERFPDSARFDLLDTRTLIQFTREPWAFAEQVMALPDEQRRLPIIVDEAQKAPAILDEAQRLIENEGLAFVLCGSSARKLKRGGGNLLGGRAWRFQLHPLTLAGGAGLRSSARTESRPGADALRQRPVPQGVGRLRQRLPERGSVRRGPYPQCRRLLALLRRPGLQPRRDAELLKHCSRLRCRLQDGQGILPNSRRHPPRCHHRTIRPPPLARHHHPRARSFTCSTSAWEVTLRVAASSARRVRITDAPSNTSS